jgi:hypothetical protein
MAYIHQPLRQRHVITNNESIVINYNDDYCVNAAFDPITKKLVYLDHRNHHCSVLLNTVVDTPIAISSAVYLDKSKPKLRNIVMACVQCGFSVSQVLDISDRIRCTHSRDDVSMALVLYAIDIQAEKLLSLTASSNNRLGDITTSVVERLRILPVNILEMIVDVYCKELPL